MPATFAPTVSGGSASVGAFVRALFEQFDAHEVRYCVLHSYDTLPDAARSDIDMAVHPDDLGRIAPAFGVLRAAGYTPIQCIEYDVHCLYFVFAWTEAGSVRTIAVDLTTQHRQGHFILQPGADLVEDRRRHQGFWVASARAEFGYLLSKKVVKRSVPGHQSDRLQELASELAPAEALAEARRLFGSIWAARVVDACRAGTVTGMLPALRAEFRRTLLWRDPLNVVRYAVTDLPRKVRRWWRPVGVVVAVFGPDGVGKSTAIEGLETQVAGAFRTSARFHWRPMWLGRVRERQATTEPHARPPYSPSWSTLRAGLHLLDYQLGYVFRVRPVLVRSGLVVFDRYAADMVVDPARYRYGGPTWLLRWLEALSPRPDLQLVLDAPPDVVFARKQEQSRDEFLRQRQGYLALARRAGAVVVDASQTQDDVAGQAAAAVVEFLGRRFERVHARWVVSASDGGPGPTTLEPFVRVVPSMRIGASAAAAYVALPSASRLRWLVPRGGIRETARALQVYTPYAPAGRVLKSAAVALVGTAPWPLLPRRLRTAITFAPGVRQLAADVLGEANPVFSLYLGEAGPGRKATVQVSRPDGSIAAYLKLPLTEHAADRLRHEVAVLEQLRRHPAMAPHVPAVLYAGECESRFVAMVSPLEGAPGPASYTAAHAAFLRLLAQVDAASLPGPVVADRVCALWQRYGQHLSDVVQQTATPALAHARESLGGITLPCGLTHGDFAPWNTRVGRHGFSVFDWDRAEASAPVWWDAFHFETQVASLLGTDARVGFDFARHTGGQGAYVLYLVKSICDAVIENLDAPTGVEHRARLLARYRDRAVWEQGPRPC